MINPLPLTRRNRQLVVCILFCFVYFLRNYTHQRAQRATTRNLMDLALPRSSSSNYVVWMYPFPPPTLKSVDDLAIENDQILICPYKNACQGRGISVNMAQLTEGTLYHSYILDHTYHKLRQLTEFCHHMQAIAMISLLKKEEGSCVQTLGGTRLFCNAQSFDSYNPYVEGLFIENGISELFMTNYPFGFLQNSNKESAISLAPDMTTEQFGTYGPYKMTKADVIRIAGRYNSGEDIQSMAGAGWYPFVSSVRTKDIALVNYTGYYIANSLQSGDGMAFPLLEDPDERRSAMNKLEIVSMFISGQKMITNNLDYLDEYTKNVYPFGCRSTLTCQFLKQRKIRSYYSACLTLTSNYEGSLLIDDGSNPSHNAMPFLEPTASNFSSVLAKARLEKDLILFVDVVDYGDIPQEVVKRARKLSADVPKSYPRDFVPYIEKMRYCYRLLSQYKNHAKVVVTSRIHVGLPAAALGTPVIFVSKNGWLPGGHERTGRVAGLLDVFHRVDKARGFNWTFGDLSGPVPPNPGNHYADRFRASFWNRLGRNSFYADSAKLFGMVPLKRMGAGMHRDDIHGIFHFIFDPLDLRDWRPKRAVETVFYFHPNAKVHIHVGSEGIGSDWGDFTVFVESGYDLSVRDFNPKALAEKVKGISVKESALQDFATQVGILLWNFGGVFLSKNTFIRGELSIDLGERYFLQEDGSVAAMISGKGSTKVLKTLLSGGKPADLKMDGKEWNTSILYFAETQKCMEDPSWKMTSTDDVAVSVDPKSLREHTIRMDSECYALIEKNCIYCDELHWEY